jgi:hypothetical protein
MELMAMSMMKKVRRRVVKSENVTIQPMRSGSFT